SYLVPSPERGGWRATRRMIQVALDRRGSAWLQGEPGTPGSGREASRPAPCGAPTRHLGFWPLTVVGPGRLLVAGEAARVRPRGEGCGPFAPRCRSRSPPTRRLRKAPPYLDRDGRSIITLRVKS